MHNKALNKTLFYKLLKQTAIVIILIFSFYACKTATANSSANKTIEQTPKLVFLNYKLYKNASTENTMTFTNKIIVEGKVKPKSNNFKLEGEEGDLVGYQLYNNEVVLDKFYISNPLIVIAETVNQDNSFIKKRIDLDSTQVSFRLQLKPNATHIRIAQLKNNNKVTPLITTKIQ